MWLILIKAVGFYLEWSLLWDGVPGGEDEFRIMSLTLSNVE